MHIKLHLLQHNYVVYRILTPEYTEHETIVQADGTRVERKTSGKHRDIFIFILVCT